MNAVILFNLSFAAYILASCMFLLWAICKKNVAKHAASGALLLGFFLHTWGILQRWIATAQPPLISLYESLTFYCWSMVFLYLIFSRWQKIQFLGGIVSFLSVLIFGVLALLDKSTQPLMPALKSNWLIIHVTSYFIGYAAATFSFILAVLHLLVKKNAPLKDTLDMLSFRFVAFAFPCLTVGLTTGSVWANVAWGSWWSWDPKETWSLITWLVYALYLHLRLFKGVRGAKSAYLNILGFACIIFTYLGVNYLLSGLHSYM